MHDMKLFSAQEVDDGAAPLDTFALQFLAQGDSWFSVGAFPPWLTSNLFEKITLPVMSCAVNCASPGLQLRRMTDTTRQQAFLRLLNGAKRRPWAGVLVSGGGNDLIEATGAPPSAPRSRRLLRRADEWGPLSDGPARYLSEEGWATFATHLRAVVDELLHQRDRLPTNRGVPLWLHTYDLATPRWAPAGAGQGPWLAPSLARFGVPVTEWRAVAAVLLGRLGTLLKDMAAAVSDGSLHVVDTHGRLWPADTQDTGATAHWHNEIHPSRQGYRLLGDAWEAALAAGYGLAPAQPAPADPPPLQ
ncbi:hypothetical protein [Ideonella sp.]|uniref:hypothetical protein n=1 Tax=Ideonella sp. TaxID=1929293 RepID=UPI0035B0EDA0